MSQNYEVLKESILKIAPNVNELLIKKETHLMRQLGFTSLQAMGLMLELSLRLQLDLGRISAEVNMAEVSTLEQLLLILDKYGKVD